MDALGVVKPQPLPSRPNNSATLAGILPSDFVMGRRMRRLSFSVRYDGFYSAALSSRMPSLNRSEVGDARVFWCRGRGVNECVYASCFLWQKVPTRDKRGSPTGCVNRENSRGEPRVGSEIGSSGGTYISARGQGARHSRNGDVACDHSRGPIDSGSALGRGTMSASAVGHGCG